MSVVCRTLDAEGCQFADDIAAALQEAGWQVTIKRTGLFDVIGLGVVWDQNGDEPPESRLLREGLRAAGLQPQSATELGLSFTQTAVIVGQKP